MPESMSSLGVSIAPADRITSLRARARCIPSPSSYSTPAMRPSPSQASRWARARVATVRWAAPCCGRTSATYELRRSWPHEGAVAIGSAGVEMMASPDPVMVYDAAVDVLSRLWHPWFSARVRFAATALGALHRDPGLRVLLVDRADFPRDKACGDGLIADSINALRAIGLLERVRALAAHAGRLVTVSPSGVAVEFDSTFLVLPRRVFDRLLFDRAIEAGSRPWRQLAGLADATAGDQNGIEFRHIPMIADCSGGSCGGRLVAWKTGSASNARPGARGAAIRTDSCILPSATWSGWRSICG